MSQFFLRKDQGKYAPVSMHSRKLDIVQLSKITLGRVVKFRNSGFHPLMACNVLTKF